MSLQGQGDEIQIIDNVAWFYFWLNWWPSGFLTSGIFLQLTLVLMMMMMMMMMMKEEEDEEEENEDRDDSDEDGELSESVMTSLGGQC